VREAAAAGERVKVVGSGHSFTGIALTDGRLVKLDRYSRVLAADGARQRVTVEAGITLRQLNEELAARGLALPNLGDIEYQTISGAIATATHGTGERFQGIASQVVGMRLATGDGSVIECSDDSEAELLHCARVGLGALGIVSTVTLQCVPAFNLRAVEEPMRVDEVLEALDEVASANEHFEFYWFPNTRWALTKRNNRTGQPVGGRTRWQEFRDDVLLQNIAFGAVCRLGRLRPSLIPRLNRLLPSQGRIDYVDRSDRAFTTPRWVRFYEMEYAIPREAAVEAFGRFRSYVESCGLPVVFPVEVRVLAGDDIPLSTAYGRDTCYIAAHVYQGMHYQQYFEAVEAIMDGYGGRPHWGKLHFQTAERLAPRYPEWERFQRARARLDPEGHFSNAYLDRVLGPICR